MTKNEAICLYQNVKKFTYVCKKDANNDQK